MASAVSHEPTAASSRLRAFLDVLLVFVVFAFDGAWPVPDVNEAHYLTKAKHFWEPQRIERDVFLSSADSHVVFFASVGGLTQVLPLPAAAWCGRLIIWGLTAWGWRRLSFALVPRFGRAALTAAAAVALSERCHMAGEWIVGGCEAKGVAFALVFSALADLITGRWNRGLVQLGGATAFHVLVGGWSIVAAGVVWLAAGRQRPTLRTWLPGLIGGGVLSLAGLFPALALSRGVDVSTAIEANRIYVYERLMHHLDPRTIAPRFGWRHAALWVGWIVLCRLIPADLPRRMLRRFVLGAGLIGLAGLAIGYGLPDARPLKAALLRFYWFRLADVMPAVGLTFELAAAATSATHVRLRHTAFIALIAVGAAHLVVVHVERTRLPFARSENLGYPSNLADWRDVCAWIKTHTPHDALFLTPKPFATFKWYAQRAEAATWKDVPQDAASLVEWRRRLNELYDEQTVWLNYVPSEKIRDFASRYDVDYLVTYRDPPLAFPQVYSNNDFVVYALRPTTERP